MSAGHSPLPKTLGLLPFALAFALGGCGNGSGAGLPYFNATDSSPRLQLDAYVNTADPPAMSYAGYITFNNSTLVTLASNGNPDGLQQLSGNGNGQSADFTVAPAATTVPGIYRLYFVGSNDSGTASAEFLVNVYPAISPTDIDVPMGGGSDVTTTVDFPAPRQNVGLAGQAIWLTLPDGSPATLATAGVQLNGTGWDSANNVMSLTLEVKPAGFPNGPGSVTLFLNAAEAGTSGLDNGQSPAPYAESIRIVPG